MTETHISRIQTAKKMFSGLGGKEGKTKALIMVTCEKENHKETSALRMNQCHISKIQCLKCVCGGGAETILAACVRTKVN